MVEALEERRLLTTVQMDTSLGPFRVELFADRFETTINFLGYIGRGDYDQSIIHRNARTPPLTGSPFVIQGGGLQLVNGSVDFIPTQPPIHNEPGISNTRGTLAMAKVAGNPDSATSQWFINLADNVGLDTNNGGFTVFGRVIGDGMTVVDAIAASPTFNFGNNPLPTSELPLRGYTQANFNAGDPVMEENLIFANLSVVPDVAPIFTPIADQNAQRGQELSVVLALTDGDLPREQLTYSLVNGPAGAVLETVDASHVRFRWTPPASAPQGNIPVTVRAVDLSGKSAETSFDAILAAPNVAPLGPESRVNTTTAGDQTDSDLAMSADGQFVVVWTGPDAAGTGMYGQRFNINGTPLGGEFPVNTFTAGNQSKPAVAVDADGDTVVVWQSTDASGNNGAIFARRFNSFGTPLGSEFLVSTTTGASKKTPDVAIDADGDFVVTWAAYASATEADVFARRFSRFGAPQGTEFRVNTDTAGLQIEPRVASAADGRLAIVWSGQGATDSAGIYGQRYDATGAAAGGQFAVNTFTNGAQNDPAIGMSAEGQFVVAWSGAGGSDAEGIYAKRFAATGAAVGSEGRINGTITGVQNQPAVALDLNGDFFISWTSYGIEEVADSNVFVQQFQNTGAKVGTEFQLNTVVAGQQTRTAVAMKADGDFVATWTSDGQDGAGLGIYGRRFNDTTDAVGPIVLNVSSPGQNNPILENERLAQSVGALVVRFSEALDTAGGAAGASSVTNPANWRLLRNGVDVSGAIQSIAFALNAVTGRYEATLTISPLLLDGDYALTARETITDLLGNALDGDGDFAPGGDFARRFSIQTPVPQGPETRVNTTTAGAQAQQALAADAAGNYVVVWASGQQDGDGVGVYAQRFNAQGVKQGPEFRVNTTTAGDQQHPAIAMTPGGAFVVTWAGAGDGDTNGVFARRFTASGAPLGDEARVNTTTAGAQNLPSVALDPSGNFVVTWQSYGQDGDAYGVYARRFAASGAPASGEARINTVTAGLQWNPRVAMSGLGDFVIAWGGSGPGDGNGGVFFRHFNADGVPQSAVEQRANTTTAFNQSTPSVGVDADGDFVIVWESFGQDGSNDGVYAQRFNAANLKQGNEFRVNETTAENQSNPQVAIDSDGDFVVIWRDVLLPNTTRGVYGRRYSASGVPQGGEFKVNTQDFVGGVAQTLPAVAMSATGDFVVAWPNQLDGSSYGVYARRYSPAQAPQALIEGPSDAYRGELLSFTFSVSGAGIVPTDAAMYAIDWNGDGSADETLPGPAGGLVATRAYPVSGAVNVRVVATVNEQESAPDGHAVQVSDFVLRPDSVDPGKTNLLWGGTPGFDAVFFVPAGGNSVTVFSQLDNGAFVNRSATASGVTGRVIAFGYGSSDVLVAEFLSAQAVSLVGGQGDDVLVGGTLGDVLEGDQGNDLLLGGTQAVDGGDTLLGGEGDDLLLGHLGADMLDGAVGGDLLVADRVDFGAELPAAVFAIQSEWLSTRPYADRVANLVGAGVGPRNNGNFFLKGGQTVKNDLAVDQLMGGTELDWFILRISQDLVSDLEAGESRTGT